MESEPTSKIVDGTDQKIDVYTRTRRSSILSVERKSSLKKLSSSLSVDEECLGGPGKCGPLFVEYWTSKGKDPSTKIPAVDVKFKVYRVSDFDQKRGTFYIDFVVMLDWMDESLELVEDGIPNFANHFYPKFELLHLTPDNAEPLDFDSFKPKYKPDKNATYGSIHRATITMKIRRTLFARLDFHEFPFDRQYLDVSIKLLSVRIPGCGNTGVRPMALHPKRWRGKDGGHEVTQTADCLAEFDILRLDAKAFSSKYGSSIKLLDDKHRNSLQEEVKNGEYYQDIYTMQMCLARESISVLWNMCFSLFVIDVMVFTGHGMGIGDLGDRLGVNLTLLLTAMAFKWVLNDSIPNVPYLTTMEKYVIASFAMLFFQGVAFWMISDAYHYRCGEDMEESFYKDWITGVISERSGSNQTRLSILDVTCSSIHVADRVVLFIEGSVFLFKNLWFGLRLLHNRKTIVRREKGYVDLSHLAEYCGEHLCFKDGEEQRKEVGFDAEINNQENKLKQGEQSRSGSAYAV